MSLPSDSSDDEPAIHSAEKPDAVDSKPQGNLFIDRLSELSFVQENDKNETVDLFLEEAILSLRDERKQVDEDLDLPLVLVIDDD